jgi:hypothetical protein
MFNATEAFTHFMALLAHIVWWQIHETLLFVYCDMEQKKVIKQKHSRNIEQKPTCG